ncbi:Aprataxin and PNK-like factor [Channa argus]|uniref:Aprataxin and PNK-like factor n=1 Tax=Channa argus TaxID=215402 RepID=A0A6G1PD93_CHAAH|nr:Aprataxin and PNK-like factor [Channa argus]KAK2918407.1 hypothetical protein Q8A73_002778 [Channa argus]
MSGFDLVPVDGGDPIHLPPGETVLGRGPFLGVSDKRVSRHHGLLDNLNGQLHLKPTHLNPCFIQSSLSDEPRPLKKDSWFLLHDGDLFSLLPGQFIYKVVAVGGDDCTPRSCQMFEEEEDKPVSPKPPMEAAPVFRQNREPSSCHKALASASLLMEEEAQHPGVNQRDSDVTPPVNRKRVLPAWMMAAAAAATAPTRPSSTLKAEKKTTAPAPTSSKQAAANQGSELREEEEEEEEEVRPRKKRRKMSDEEPAQSKADIPSEQVAVRNRRGPSRSEVSEESDTFTVEEEEEGKGNTPTQIFDVTEPETENKNPKHGRTTTKPKPTESVGSNGSSASTVSKPRLRTPCPYGKDCYRKNPIHFQECSHPSDTDYEEEEEEEEADRPECPYGTECYRKNPLHRKEFRHTKKPARATRSAPRKPDDDDEDEEEYDDSFINDDSEDVADDSDYVPPDSDDSGKEDVRRLQTEAKVFLKRKK